MAESNMPTQKSFANGAEFPPLADGTLRIYSMRFCPFAQRTRLVLAHKQIPHETVNVHLRPVEKKPDWFLQRNPLGLVPVLEKDGKIVYESTVCNEYLDAVYPEKPLLPKDPLQKAHDDMLLARFGKVISPFYQYLRSEGSEELFQELQNSLQPFEDAICERGNFFGGENVGMLDYNIWPYIERMPVLALYFNKDVLPIEKFPNLRAWSDRMMGVAAVKECYFSPQEHMDFYKSSKGGSPDYDMGLKE